MTASCGTHGIEEKYLQIFSRNTLEERICRRSMRMCKSDTEMCLNGIGIEEMALSFLTQGRDKWRVIVDMPAKKKKLFS
jgi:hypothetical protein